MSTRFAPLKKQPAYMQVFERLEAEILSGRWPEDEALPTEMDLCRQFHVQRSTIREGIRLLEQSGLVRRGIGKRLFPRRPQADETAASTRRSLERHGVSFIDIWETIATMLPQTARLAALKMQDPNTQEPHLQRLAQITAAIEASRNSQDITNLAGDYLEAVWQATDNRVMAVLLQSLNMLIQSSLAYVIDELPQPKRRILNAQRNMNDAFVAGDAEQAAVWMSRHIDDLKRGYEVAGVDLAREVASFNNPEDAN
ncbi:MAG: GntR family transcriptional regulator [Pseudomonadota bacterium]